MPKYDCQALVIGAGPSGAIAARELARRGHHTLLLDRAEFPRAKPCGDGLTMRALEILEDLGLAQEFFARYQPLEMVRLFAPAGHGLEFKVTDDPTEFGYVIPRKEVDHFLWQKAQEAGAEFRRGRVLKVEMDAEGVTAHTDQDEVIRAPYLVLAAGGLSPLPVQLGFSGEFLSQAVATRGYYENVADLENSEDVYLFQERTAGYIWIFTEPGGIANVGLGIDRDDYKKIGKNLTDVLRHWIAKDHRLAPRFANARELNVEGHLIPLGLRQGALVRGRTLLVGDAAGVANPVTGEGVSYGMASGISAAMAIDEAVRTQSEAPLAEYERALKAELEGKFKKMEFANGFLKHPEFTNYFIKLAQRKPELKERMQGFLRSPRKRGPKVTIGDMLRWVLLP